MNKRTLRIIELSLEGTKTVEIDIDGTKRAFVICIPSWRERKIVRRALAALDEIQQSYPEIGEAALAAAWNQIAAYAVYCAVAELRQSWLDPLLRAGWGRALLSSYVTSTLGEAVVQIIFDEVIRLENDSRCLLLGGMGAEDEEANIEPDEFDTAF